MATIKGIVSVERGIEQALEDFPQVTFGNTKVFLTPYMQHGGEISNDPVVPETRLTVAEGVWASSDNTRIIKCEPWTIDLSGPWVQGDGGNKLVDVGALDPLTTYHIFAIGNSAGNLFDYCVSPNLIPTLPAGFTTYRRIGSRQTDGNGNLIIIHQDGDWHEYADIQIPIEGVDVSTSGTLYNIGTPIGVECFVQMIISPGSVLESTGEMAIQIRSAGLSSETIPAKAPQRSAFRGLVGAYNIYGTWYSTTAETIRRTNTSGQVYLIRSAGSYNQRTDYTTIQVIGYYDKRGRR